MAAFLLRLLALLQLGTALFHFLWLPELERQLAQPGAASPAIQQLALLSSASVGLLLAALGFLALRASRRNSFPAARLVAAACAGAWLGRAVLERIYPVAVPVFGVHAVSPLILLASIALATLWAITAILAAPGAEAQPVPESALTKRHPLAADYADSYAAVFPASTSVEQALAAFTKPPAWLDGVMRLRDALLARPLGLAPRRDDFCAREAAGEMFHIIERSDTAVLMAEEDNHLRFQVLLAAEPAAAAVRVSVTTLVQFRNWRGRAYFLPVRFGHRWIVETMLGRAQRAAWRALGLAPF